MSGATQRAALVMFHVLLRAGSFAIVQPAREVLFTVVARQEKYKAKNFIDTVVHRSGDMLSGWCLRGWHGSDRACRTSRLWQLPVALA